MFSFVSNENFILYAAQNYINSENVTELDFQDDIDKIKLIQKICVKYDKNKVINVRLLLNHLRLLYNVFHHEGLTRMLALKLKDHLHVIKPFLMLLGYWPDSIDRIGSIDTTIRDDDIGLDSYIVEELRKI
jgi:hypothetical protein